MRDDVERQRRAEESKAKTAYSRSRNAVDEMQRSGSRPAEYWALRIKAMALQVEGDMHAYAENVLALLLNPPAVQTYRAHDDGHEHTDAAGADGRDDHAS